MKKFLLISFVFILITNLTKAQAPAWTVNSQDYAYQMAVVAAINLDGVEATNTQTTLGAFIDNECRGVAKLVYIASVKRYLIYMNVYSNAGEGLIQFKVYDAQKNRTLNLEQTEQFEIQKLTGSTNNPLVLSYPRLSSEAKFFSFKLAGQERSEIVDNNVTVVVPFGSSLSNLVAEYTTSALAKVYVGTQLQTSATTSNSFTSPVVYKIISADDTKQAEYTVNVKYGNATPTDITLSNDKISENALAGTAVGTLQGQDADGDLVFTYSLVAGSGDTDNAFFAIDNNKLTLAKKLDYEAKRTYSLRVKADDGKGGTVQKILLVNALNENDTAPVVLAKTLNIPENQLTETLVYKMEVTDVDGQTAFTYKITDGNQDGKFSIHQEKGEIKIANQIDYETDKRNYTLEVVVNDGLNETKAYISFIIDNVNDISPVVETATIPVSEAAAIGTVIYKLQPTDVDGDKVFSYSIENTNPVPFEVSPAGEIKVKSVLDYENVKRYELKVGVSDGLIKGTYLFTVNVQNENDQPTFITITNDRVSEKALNGTIIGSFLSEDVDGLDKMTYSLVAGSGDKDNAYFRVDGDALKLNQPVDYEKQKTYSIRVKAKDTDADHGETVIIIYAVNENDVAPVLKDAVVNIPENQNLGTIFHTMVATDEDGASTFKYRFIDGNQEGKFHLHEDKGEIRNLVNLDYESAKKTYVLEVLVSDGIQEGRAFVTVNIQNVNDNVPVVKEEALQLSENTAVGTQILQLNPTDADGLSMYIYRVVDANSSFEVTSLGQIRLKTSLDYEKAKSHQIRIGISDGLNEGIYTFPLQVLNENDEKPVLITKIVEINEKAAPGTLVVKLEASDADKDNSPLTFKLLDAASPFALSTSGTLITSKALSYNIQSSYKLPISIYDQVNTTEAVLEVVILQDAIINIQVSNVITPNGDGYNDTWEIKDGHLFENYTFKVISSQGKEVFFQKGYRSPFWDGRFQGRDFPVGTYIYIVQSEDKSKTFKGTLSILR